MPSLCNIALMSHQSHPLWLCKTQAAFMCCKLLSTFLIFVLAQAILQQQLPLLIHSQCFLQGKNAEKDIDVLVKTMPKGKHGLNDRENITAAVTQAGLGLVNRLLLAWDIWIRGLASGEQLPLRM